MLYNGYIYESVYQTDLFLNDEEAKKKYDEYQEDLVLSEISENGNTDLEEDLTQTNVSVPLLLRKWNLKGRAVNDDYIFEEADGYFIIRNRTIIPVEDILDNPDSYYELFPEFANLETKMSEDFWRYPEPLYHATKCENIEEIKKEGLYPGRGSGLTNRGVFGVFTSTEEDGYIDHYGECKFMIDTAKMKRDGNMPLVLREPEVFNYIVSNIVGEVYGINVEREVSSSGGMDPNTWIIDAHVNPEYLILVQGGDSDDDY